MSSDIRFTIMELDSSFIHYLYYCLFTSIDIVEMVLTIYVSVGESWHIS